MYCEQCQTTAVDGTKFCPNCGGKLSPEGGARAVTAFAEEAATVVLTVGPCESCGAPSLPGSTLCLPCKRAFESILGSEAPTTDMPAVHLPVEAATIVQPQAPPLPSAPGPVVPAVAAAVPVAAATVDDEPLADDEEYEDEEGDDLMAEEAATVLATAPPAPPEPAFSAGPDWDGAAAHENIVAVPAWARKGPDGEQPPAPEPAAEHTGPEPVPWWERNGQANGAPKPETARYVPPPSSAPPPSTSLDATVARQQMRPKPPSASIPVPVVARASGNRNRTLVVAAALAGLAAIGTPFAWKLAFASKPTRVSALTAEYDATPAPAPAAAPRPERTHGTPAPAPAQPRVYEDLLPPDAAPAPARATAPAPAPARSPAPAPPRTATKKPGQPAPPAPAPEPAPEPAPLLVATPPPVVAAPAAAAPPPAASLRAEAVPLGQVYEVSQVDERPQVTSRFDPVMPARLAGTPQVVVIVRVLVSPSGRAVDASAVRNPIKDDGLSAAAAATVKQWSFNPARKKGQPVSCWFNVGVPFKATAGD